MVSLQPTTATPTTISLQYTHSHLHQTWTQLPLLSLQGIGVGWSLGFPGEEHSLPRAPLTIWKLENEASMHLLGNKTQGTIYSLIVAVICRSCVYLTSPIFYPLLRVSMETFCGPYSDLALGKLSCSS